MNETELHRAVTGAHRALKALHVPVSPYKELLVEQNRYGGFLCVACPEGVPFLIVSVGRPNPEKVERYRSLCEEKARRLGTHPEHERSYDSRNPDQDQFSGAVRGTKFIVSFSGFPEEVDEVFSLLLLYELNELSVSDLADRLNRYQGLGHKQIKIIRECLG